MWIRQYAPVSVICGEHETESVRLAVENLKRDLRRVLNCQLCEAEESSMEDPAGCRAEDVSESRKESPGSKKECEPENGKEGEKEDALESEKEDESENGKEGASENGKEGVSEIGKGVPGREQENPPGAVLRIIVGTAGQTDEIVHDAGLERLRDEEGNLRKEAFLLQEKNGELFIVGSDRRGTIYGIYEFCEKWLGVSPWYFFADVPVKVKQEVEIPSGFVKVDWPSVEYRGIFINDEEELEHWVQRYMGEPTIGVKTYEKIFELLLRLKMNYIWPAMHVNSFNAVRENGALADRMGIVVGTSHCDMLMRSNNREWYPWLRKKGYTDAVYDFSLPGRNREILKEYWRESIEQNRDFEVSYTLGMRGIHDSGFEVRALEGKTGRELLEAKIELLDSVIKTQEELLRENLGKETVKTFVPYKEVLELYDNGLEVPEDLTLIWVNDNYGYVRRYPGEKEKRRRGGNGLYYHNSYWAPPGGSYLFICSIPLSHTRNELKKAYEEGIRKIWVTNFGAMKPLEQQMSFYAAYAWEAGREGALTENEQAFLRQWIDRTFSGGYGAELAPILTEFDQLTNARKVEQMDFDAFSQTAWGDEAAGRIHRYEEMFAVVNRIWKALPREEQDAFFQMIGMKVHAAYYTNLMYYYADRSNLCMARGKKKAARKYTDLCREFDHARRSMLHYYNHVMSGGKWNGILTPEDFPPPRTAMHPACMPPVGELSPVEEILSAEDTLEYMPLNGDALSSGEELQAEEIPLAGKGPWEGGDGSEGEELQAEEIPLAGKGPREGGDGSEGEELQAEEISLAGKGSREGGDSSDGGKAGAAGSRKCNPVVTIWNDGQEIVFTQPAVKWIEIDNEGNVPVKYRLSGPDWIRFAETGTSEAECLVDTEARVLFAPDRDEVLALLEAAVELSGRKAAGRQKTAVEPSCRKTIGQLEAPVEPSGQKTVGRQEAVVEPSGQKTVGRQEAAVELSCRKAAGQLETAVEPSGQKTVGQQEAAVELSGRKMVGQQEAAVELSGRKTVGQQEAAVEPSVRKAVGQQGAAVEPSCRKTIGQLEAPGCQTSRLSGFIRIQDWEGRTVDSVPVSVRFGQRGETAAVWKESKASKWKEEGFSGAGKENRSMGGIKQGTKVFRATGQQPSRDFLGSVEDDGRICAEAEEGRICAEAEEGRIGSETEQICNGTEQIKNYGEAVQGRSFGEAEQSKGCEEASPDGLFEETAPRGTCENNAGWRRIPNLGRDSGSLLEAREPGAQVSWQVTVLTPGSHLLELHRFPSLNSVGAIQVGVSVDQGPVQILESESNDEYRGSWKENIRNNVDKIYLRLPHMEAGTHRITFHAMSRYFAFTRIVIYTGERRENSLGREGGDQRLPRTFDIRGFVEENYGKEAASLLPRPVLYLPENPRGGTLDAEDIMVQPSAWGKPVKAEELVESGRSLPGEKDGRLLIECGAALADTAFARMENYRWQWCASPSHGETGLALYIREYGKHWTDAADAPALRYLFRVQGGNYNIWIRAMMWGDDTCHFTIGLDGELVPESALYGGRGIWRYSNEQVWKWIPVWKAQLTEGEHELRIVTFSSRLRFEQIYITDGRELPPALG